MLPKTKEAIKDIVLSIKEQLQLPNIFDKNKLQELVKSIDGDLQFVTDLDNKVDATIERLVDNPQYAFRITVKETNEKRDNFSIAHELGHLFLHMGYKANNDIWQNSKIRYDRFGYSQSELEANEFAGNLLMPENEFRKQWQEKNIENIADYFNVSKLAVEIRAKNLGLISW